MPMPGAIASSRSGSAHELPASPDTLELQSAMQESPSSMPPLPSKFSSSDAESPVAVPSACLSITAAPLQEEGTPSEFIDMPPPPSSLAKLPSTAILLADYLSKTGEVQAEEFDGVNFTRLNDRPFHAISLIAKHAQSELLDRLG